MIGSRVGMMLTERSCVTTRLPGSCASNVLSGYLTVAGPVCLGQSRDFKIQGEILEYRARSVDPLDVLYLGRSPPVGDGPGRGDMVPLCDWLKTPLSVPKRKYVIARVGHDPKP